LLADGLNRLPELAKQLEHPFPQFVDSTLDPTSTKWSLVLDHDEPGGIASRPHLPYKGRLTAIPIKSKDAGVKFVQPPPVSQELQPEVLDRLTVADDQTFLDRLREELNLPDYVKAGLSEPF
jgi:5-methylthioadenosine/S-adenosylhomocysteine deaminase